jgi:hypothetical protein
MKKLFAIAFAALLLTGMAAPVLAATNPYKGVCATQGEGVGNASVCQADGSDPLTGPNGTITKATTALAIVAGIVSVIFLIVGGIKFIFSNGDSSAVSSAKKTIIYSLIGLVVAVLSREIISFVINKF